MWDHLRSPESPPGILHGGGAVSPGHGFDQGVLPCEAVSLRRSFLGYVAVLRNTSL